MGYIIKLSNIIKWIRQLDLEEKPIVSKNDLMAKVQQVTESLKTSDTGDVFPVPIGSGAIRGRRQIDFENFGSPRTVSSLGEIGKQGYCAGSCSMSVGISQWSNPQTFYPQWIGLLVILFIIVNYFDMMINHSY